MCRTVNNVSRRTVEPLNDGDPGLKKKKVYTAETLKEAIENGKELFVVDQKVYDYSGWKNRHPGGVKILKHYVGSDATDAFIAFHPKDSGAYTKLNHFHVGNFSDGQAIDENRNVALEKDFREFRDDLEKRGMFKSQRSFFLGHFLQLVLLEVIATYIIYNISTSYLAVLVSGILLGTMQTQAGWTQHDYGHMALFHNYKFDRLAQNLIIGLMKGFSTRWWNYRHNIHHAKPNIVKRDPDVQFPNILVLGSKIPVEWGKAKRRGYLPFNFQQDYFFFFLPPLLLPFYFVYEVLFFCIRGKLYYDLTLFLLYFLRFGITFIPQLGLGKALLLYFTMRIIESSWFVFMTQMSHIPMEVEKNDAKLDWMSQQMVSTCNIKGNYFNNWFSGHLNYQIEHHLFPLMPRHNYPKIEHEVRELCRKHDIKYVCKRNLLDGVGDIYRSLKKSGDLWYESYHM
ncbi:hypothetical protein SNEBB_010411 [Seison nebaliae]|nr:hypothetical protein SNEBB_010411 [Seison nebaliae]